MDQNSSSTAFFCDFEQKLCLSASGLWIPLRIKKSEKNILRCKAEH